ncbi:phosphatidylethanolamine N-methyltransferase /phosphatidyl-N-methylethanolamine N-methyltransferase [Crenobacter luteus]|uniref:class I SAM-dependent methyltransferase n=1 Tax=Crenobacter luteus TaxID=1452487 RepID=UPI00104D33B8|nr:methyltransferase domain-containing protein [Crenobacter luteus]TCP15110.1 phosphatidylethanolamine N-methyltransferase /phosphatidyl-N-methylethanolamine N-methyltransferase [Crenobacter luteus]
MAPLHPLLTRLNRWRYTLYAPIYDRVAGAFARQRRRAIALLAPQPDERVLIVGAGTGLDLDYLLAQRALTAIDLTPAMVDALAARAAHLGLAVDARVMDAEALAFPDESFDAVVLHLILAVVPDPVACLSEVERVLKPGGRVVVFDKFLPDGARPGLARRLLNLIARLVATDINRRLGDILAATRLTKIHDEDAGFGGFFRIALLRK